MEETLSKILRRAAQPHDQMAEAAERRALIESVEHNAQMLVNLMGVGLLIPAHELSFVLDQGEQAGLISRAGMRKSGLLYVILEDRFLAARVALPAEDVAVTLSHVHRQASRALNIINNPRGYIPRQNGSLYGYDRDTVRLILQ